VTGTTTRTTQYADAANNIDLLTVKQETNTVSFAKSGGSLDSPAEAVEADRLAENHHHNQRSREHSDIENAAFTNWTASCPYSRRRETRI
jgi:hypothetical protein